MVGIDEYKKINGIKNWNLCWESCYLFSLINGINIMII
jgi:hypothetical protein